MKSSISARTGFPSNLLGALTISCPSDGSDSAFLMTCIERFFSRLPLAKIP
jgi:hypothetical protein